MRVPALLLAAALPLEAQVSPPPVPREFRAVWVASVSNIDWPSRPGLSAWQQQAEMIAILNRAASMNLNAVILQVRPAGDALYASHLEPWSEYLTGKMGLPPSPWYDPLEFAVTEAHRRGLELHAWFNPYRARHPSAKSAMSPAHVSVGRPHLVRQYGTHLWMDPGDTAVQTHTTNVILDVVKRYDVDGVHIDDYFYPYKERDSAKAVIDFPDSVTYARYQAAGGKLSRHDWRRANVDSLVRRIYREVKRTKRRVMFGVSPFGIWRPSHPPTVRGFDAFTELYADSRTWLNRGWLDYFAPQLYYHTKRVELDHPGLLQWWVSQNPHRRHMWPGNYTSRIGTSNPEVWDAAEIMRQIDLTRRQPGATGNIHFSSRVLMANRDSISDRLLAGPYAQPALVPASPWLDSVPPRKPTVRARHEPAFGGLVLDLRPAGREEWLWTVRVLSEGKWSVKILPGWTTSHPLTDGRQPIPDAIVVTAVDRNGNESAAVTITPPFTAAPRN